MDRSYKKFSKWAKLASLTEEGRKTMRNSMNLNIGKRTGKFLPDCDNVEEISNQESDSESDVDANSPLISMAEDDLDVSEVPGTHYQNYKSRDKSLSFPLTSTPNSTRNDSINEERTLTEEMSQVISPVEAPIPKSRRRLLLLNNKSTRPSLAAEGSSNTKRPQSVHRNEFQEQGAINSPPAKKPKKYAKKRPTFSNKKTPKRKVNMDSYSEDVDISINELDIQLSHTKQEQPIINLDSESPTSINEQILEPPPKSKISKETSAKKKKSSQAVWATPNKQSRKYLHQAEDVFESPTIKIRKGKQESALKSNRKSTVDSRPISSKESRKSSHQTDDVDESPAVNVGEFSIPEYNSPLQKQKRWLHHKSYIEILSDDSEEVETAETVLYDDTKITLTENVTAPSPQSKTKKPMSSKTHQRVLKELTTPFYNVFNQATPLKLLRPEPSPEAVRLGLRRSKRVRPSRPLMRWIGEDLIYSPLIGHVELVLANQPGSRPSHVSEAGSTNTQPEVINEPEEKSLVVGDASQG